MEKRKITLEVSPEEAEAFEKATPEQRRRALRAVRYALMNREKATEELERILDDLAEEARASGLTEETLKKLLDDE